MTMMMTSLVGIVAACVLVGAQAETFLTETFQDAEWRDRWVDSNWKGEASMGTWEWTAGEWFDKASLDGEPHKGIQTKDKAKFYGISRKLETPFSNKDQDLVVQFSVKNEGRSTSFCGGGYIKLMGSDIDQEKFGGDTPYSIMFGPDLCGYDVSRIHLIFNYKGENLLKSDDIKLEYADKNEMTHLYTLHVRPDNTYTVLMDQKEKSSGSLADGWPFPPKEIDDKDDKKPDDWVDEEMMLDPEDTKPEGYDDIPAEIPDADATKPEDWDDDDDGEWEAPMVPNPDFKGPWKQKKIPNPDYKGPWKPKQIPNPDYDEESMKLAYASDDIGSVGFELWIVDSGSIFDNIYVGTSMEEANEAAKAWEATVAAETEAKAVIDKAEEEATKAAEEAEAAAAEAQEAEIAEAEEKEL